MFLSIKSYLRKPISAINIIILSIILTSIIIICNLNNYYKEEYNNIYRTNSYIYTNNINDLEDKNILKYDIVKEININNEILNNENNKTYLLLKDNNECKIYMTQFLFNAYKDLLKEQEIIIGNQVLDLSDVRISNYNYIEVPQSIYDLFNNDLAYIISLKDYYNIDNYNLIYTGDTDSYNTLLIIKNTIKLTKYLFIIIMVLFIITYLIILIELIKNEYDNMIIERYLGYNKKQIKEIVYIKIIITNIISMLLSLILLLIVTFTLKNINKEIPLNLAIANYLIIAIIITTLLFITIISMKGGEKDECY